MTSQFKPGEIYQTRGGRDARIYADDGGGRCPIHGAIRMRDGYWWSHTWGCDGHYIAGATDKNDLIPPEPEKYVRWLNIFIDDEGRLFILDYRAREKADAAAAKMTRSRRIACIRIEYADGGGL